MFEEGFENVVYNCDCLELMKEMERQGIVADWLIADPPYGIGIDGQKQSINNKNPKHNRKKHDKKNWDNKIPDKEYFDLMFKVSKNQIIWGANYCCEYLKNNFKGWIIWDKGQHGLTMSDCEIAFVSSNNPTRVIEINRVELLKDQTIHPTQKPLKLYINLLNMFTKENDLILDPFMGSFTTAVACYKMGRRYLGAELDKEYFEKGTERLNKLKSQISFFD